VHPKKGSIVASPVLAAYDPDPDYFFHWFRDSAVVIDALRLLRADGSITPAPRSSISRLRALQPFVTGDLDGRALVTAPAWRAGVQPDFRSSSAPMRISAAVRTAGCVRRGACESRRHAGYFQLGASAT
jgi:hypothetical protein